MDWKKQVEKEVLKAEDLAKVECKIIVYQLDWEVAVKNWEEKTPIIETEKFMWYLSEVPGFDDIPELPPGSASYPPIAYLLKLGAQEK